MITSIKVRLHPNNKQLTKLFQYAGCARFAYNWAIARERDNYEQGNKFLSNNDLRKEFTQLKKRENYKWLNNISNNVPKQAIKDACNAYKRFFKGQCKYPKFKTRKHTTPSFYQDNVAIQFTDTHVKVEGFAISKKRNKQQLNWIKLCSCCGNVKSDLKLSDRIYRCTCGNTIDRDFQASLNLKKYGETVLHQSVI